MQQLSAFPAQGLVRQWLKAGHVERGVKHETTAGTPQGGIISPLLANIVLHGMEDCLDIRYRLRKTGWERRPGLCTVVRYADDFVVLAQTLETVEWAKTRLATWLAQRGLVLSEDKTRITHLSAGFDFLGFNIREQVTTRKARGKILLTRPRKASINALKRRLTKEWQKLAGTNAKVVVQTLSPIILGWANYFRVGVSSEVFRTIDDHNHPRALRWTKRTHPKKSKAWRSGSPPPRNSYWIKQKSTVGRPV